MPDDCNKTHAPAVPVCFNLEQESADGKKLAHATDGGAIIANLHWSKSLGGSRVHTEVTSTIGSVLRDYQHDESEGESETEVCRRFQVDLRGARGVARVTATLKDEPEEGGLSEETAHSGARITHWSEVRHKDLSVLQGVRSPRFRLRIARDTLKAPVPRTTQALPCEYDHKKITLIRVPEFRSPWPD